jgi:hypothetical protein
VALGLIWAVLLMAAVRKTRELRQKEFQAQLPDDTVRVV